MIRPGKGSLAHIASIGLDPGVLPHVATQLVRAGELPATALPGAEVRLLPRVYPHVGLHVGCLVVHLPAAGLDTGVQHRGPFHNLPSAPLGDLQFLGG
jgi:hypothetical protein